MEQQLCFSLKQAATQLNTSRTVLYRLIKSGEIRTFNIGGRRMISFQALSEYISKQESEPLVLINRRSHKTSA